MNLTQLLICFGKDQYVFFFREKYHHRLFFNQYFPSGKCQLPMTRAEERPVPAGSRQTHPVVEEAGLLSNVAHLEPLVNNLNQLLKQQLSTVSHLKPMYIFPNIPQIKGHQLSCGQGVKGSQDAGHSIPERRGPWANWTKGSTHERHSILSTRTKLLFFI